VGDIDDEATAEEESQQVELAKQAESKKKYKPFRMK